MCMIFRLAHSQSVSPIIYLLFSISFVARVSGECERVRGPSTQWFSSHVVQYVRRINEYGLWVVIIFFSIFFSISYRHHSSFRFVLLNYSEFSRRAREYYDSIGRIARIHNLRAHICSRKKSAGLVWRWYGFSAFIALIRLWQRIYTQETATASATSAERHR